MDSRVAASPAIAARSNPTSPCTDANRSSTRANASAGSSPASGSRYSSSSIILSLSAQSAIVTDPQPPRQLAPKLAARTHSDLKPQLAGAPEQGRFHLGTAQIGRESCRERVCQDV